MPQINIETIGYIATFLGAIQLIPELSKALRTHHLRDVSWGMLWIMIISSILWTIYGIGLNIVPLVISAVINGIIEIILIALKIRYAKKGQPLIKQALAKSAVTNNRT